MPKLCYEEKNFRKATLEIINTANTIIETYVAQGFVLTLRQLYYQMVARDIILNNEKEYGKLSRTISDARLAGMIDWDHIEDRTRNVRSTAHFNDPSDIMSAAASQYRIDKWSTQPCRVEVWIEKDALVGVIAGVCDNLDLPYFSCRGYTSQSEMWAGSQRLLGYIRKGQRPVILHLGDHDPSGIDMTRDIVDRMTVFMGGAEVERLALNYSQIEQYDPPPNLLKDDDTRKDGYGFDSSWELDALEPTVIAALIESAVTQVRDNDLWNKAAQEEDEGRTLLMKASDQWTELCAVLEK